MVSGAVPVPEPVLSTLRFRATLRTGFLALGGPFHVIRGQGVPQAIIRRGKGLIEFPQAFAAQAVEHGIHMLLPDVDRREIPQQLG